MQCRSSRSRVWAWGSDLVLILARCALLGLPQAATGTPQCSRVVQVLRCDPPFHAQAATGAPQCSVYAMAPGSIILGINLMAAQVSLGGHIDCEGRPPSCGLAPSSHSNTLASLAQRYDVGHPYDNNDARVPSPHIPDPLPASLMGAQSSQLAPIYVALQAVLADTSATFSQVVTESTSNRDAVQCISPLQQCCNSCSFCVATNTFPPPIGLSGCLCHQHGVRERPYTGNCSATGWHN